MKTALITGASSGIGLELAHIFAAHKTNLVLVARNQTQLQLLAQELQQKYNVQVMVCVKDLSKTNQVNELVTELNNTPISYLINNAGFGEFGAFNETTWQKNEDQIAVNITAPTHLTHALLPKMVAQKFGKILNVASVAGFLPGPNMAVYYATKAYVLHFSEAIAYELKNTGVTVTALCPGPTASAFMERSGMGASKLIKGRTLPTAKSVAEYGYAAMQKGKSFAIPGLGNYLMSILPGISPRKLTTAVVGLLQAKPKN